jgi:hypothetical protein
MTTDTERDRAEEAARRMRLRARWRDHHLEQAAFGATTGRSRRPTTRPAPPSTRDASDRGASNRDETSHREIVPAPLPRAGVFCVHILPARFFENTPMDGF